MTKNNDKKLILIALSLAATSAFANPFLVDKEAKAKEEELSSVKGEVQNLKQSLNKLMELQQSLHEQKKTMTLMTEEMSENVPPEPPSLSEVMVNYGARVELEKDIPDQYTGFLIVNGEYVMKNTSDNSDLPYLRVSKDAFMSRLIDSKTSEEPQP